MRLVGVSAYKTDCLERNRIYVKLPRRKHLVRPIAGGADRNVELRVVDEKQFLAIWLADETPAEIEDGGRFLRMVPRGPTDENIGLPEGTRCQLE